MATYKLLDSYTVGAGGASSVTFSNIPQTYTDLLVKYTQRNNASNNYNPVLVQFNSTTTGSNVELYGNGSSASAGTNAKAYVGYVNGNNTTANTFSNVEFYIPNYTSTNKKSISIDSVTENNGTTALADLAATLQDLTSPITSMTFTIDAAANFAQYGTFYLYGVWADLSTGTPSAPTIGTASAGVFSASVPFTPAGSGNTAVTYTAISTPGSITGTATSSPITVSGLDSATSYTFKVAGVNPIGTGTYSAASNSITPLGTSFESIATVTVGSGGAALITFTDGGSWSNYTHLQIRVLAKTDRNDPNDALFPYFNNDTSQNYWSSSMWGEGTGTAQIARTPGTGMYYNGWIPGAVSNSSVFGANIIDILDFRNTNKYKTVKTYGGYSNNTNGLSSLISGAWLSTSAITVIKITPTVGSNFVQYSKFALYGIKG